MQPETNLRTSFFDDDDLNLKFEFGKLEKIQEKYLNAPALIESPLLRQLSDSLDKGVYALHSRILVYYENNKPKVPQIVLDLAHSRLMPLTTEEDGYFGFIVQRNGTTHKFFSKEQKIIEKWMHALKGVCVLTNFHDEYKALKMIGKGSFAKVYLVESKSNRKHFAVKAFTKEGVLVSNKGNAKPAMYNEIEIMRALDHENILKLFEVYETEKSIYLVIELVQGKTLQELLKKQAFKEENSETKIINAVRSLLEANAYQAIKGVMHRDLKPDNILMDKNDKIKIIDFGLATFLDVPEYIFKKCGTPGYIAPEIFKFDMKNPKTAYDGHCDVFSVGCILYYMFFGTPLFEGIKASEILKHNRKFVGELDAINNVHKELKNPDSKFSKDGMHLLLQLLEFDHKKRPSAVEALQHPFFTPVPSGMQKIPGFNESYIEGYSRAGNYSPMINSPVKRSSPSASPDKSSPLHNRERFNEKDSLYLDTGKPEINGRIDTLNSGTTNSLMFNNRLSELSSPEKTSQNSMSPFGKGSLGDYKRSSASKSFKGHSTFGGNQTFMKAAIHRNIQKQNDEESKDDSSPVLRLEQVKTEKRHRNSDFMGSHLTGHSAEKGRTGSQSPGYPKSESVSNDNSPFHLKVEQVQLSNVNPIIKSTHIGNRRFQPLSQKNYADEFYKNKSDVVPRK